MVRESVPVRPSLLSTLVLAGACSAAAAGWFGVRLDLPVAGQGPAAIGRLAGVGEAGPEGQTAPPGVRNRAAWQPSPVPSQGAAAQGAALAVERPAAPGAVTLPPNVPFVPLEDSFTTDRLEAAFDGALPDAQGEWREVGFFSRALGRDVSYMVWLPPGYSSPAAGADAPAAEAHTYPTLYLLHGAGGPAGFGVEEWLGYALTEDLDRLVALGLIEPMIVVLPNGEQGYWMNHADGGPKWADFVALDLVNNVDATFRTDARRERRAVGGLSMGGHGALQLAMNHPDVFAVAGAHSPTLRSFEDSPEFFGDQKWFARFDPLSLVKGSDAARKVAFWIDAGNDDRWGAGAAVVAKALEAKQAQVTYRVLEGEHEGWYWKYYLPEYLNFYSEALNAAAQTAQGAPAIAYRPLGPIYNSASAAAVRDAAPFVN
jgi:enterochelin esterase-like enzyme